jgi:acetylornithine deacetylase
VSAVEKFWTVFAALRRLEAERNAVKHPLMTRFDIPLAIEIGTLQAGSWVSSVPDLLVAEGRYGVALGEDLGSARAVFETAVAEACADDPWLRGHPVTVEWWGGQFAPGMTDPDSEIVRTVRRAHEAVSRAPQQIWAAPYGSDLRLMTNLGGVPTVHYGPGDARLAHGPMESVPIQEVLTATRALAVVALTHCGVG